MGKIKDIQTKLDNGEALNVKEFCVVFESDIKLQSPQRILLTDENVLLLNHVFDFDEDGHVGTMENGMELYKNEVMLSGRFLTHQFYYSMK